MLNASHQTDCKNIGHSFHHIDLWIACCYDPDSTSRVHPSSKLPNYVFCSVSYTLLSTEQKAIKVNILEHSSRSLKQFIERVSIFFLWCAEELTQNILQNIWTNGMLVMTDTHSISNVFTLCTAHTFRLVLFFFCSRKCTFAFYEAAIKNRVRSSPFVGFSHPRIQIERNTNGCLITWHRTRLHTTKLLLCIVRMV